MNYVSKKNFETLIVSGNNKSLPNSAQSDMGWLMNTQIEVVDMLLNYIYFLRTDNRLSGCPQNYVQN